MGVTVSGRREWLAKLRADLIRVRVIVFSLALITPTLLQAEATRTLGHSFSTGTEGGTESRRTRPRQKLNGKPTRNNGSTLRDNWTRLSISGNQNDFFHDDDGFQDPDVEGWTGAGTRRGLTGGVSPSAFLQCLRSAGVSDERRKYSFPRYVCCVS